MKRKENIKGERRESLPVHGGEISDFTRLLSKIIDSESTCVAEMNPLRYCLALLVVE